MQAEIEALRKNWIQKCPDNRNYEWVNLESRNLVPGDLVKLECGGLVRADREVWEGKIDPSEYVSSDWRSQNYFPACDETNQVGECLLPSLAAKPASFEGEFSQLTLTRLPFCLLLDMGCRS